MLGECGLNSVQVIGNRWGCNQWAWWEMKSKIKSIWCVYVWRPLVVSQETDRDRRIVEPHKQVRVQRAIVAEVGRSKTVILHFLTDPESYGTKSGRPKKDQGNVQDGPKVWRYSPGRGPSSGGCCELQHCPVERPSYYHTDEGPQSWGMPAATCPQVFLSPRRSEGGLAPGSGAGYPSGGGGAWT